MHVKCDGLSLKIRDAIEHRKVFTKTSRGFYRIRPFLTSLMSFQGTIKPSPTPSSVDHSNVPLPVNTTETTEKQDSHGQFTGIHCTECKTSCCGEAEENSVCLPIGTRHY